MVGAHAVTVVSLLALPTAALAVSAPHEELLPDVDVRKASPEPALERAQNQLERSLGPLGFADPSATGQATGFVGRTDGYLSGRSRDSARRVALDYARENRAAFGLDGDDIEALEVDDESYTSWEGVRHLTFSQLVDGVPSYDTFVRANVDSEGRLINLSGGPAGDLELDDPNPRLDRKQALLAARRNVDGSRSLRVGELESARLVAFAKPDGEAELAWAVYAESDEGFLYEVVIGADSGEVLLRQSRTNFANQADVWNLHPDQNVPPTRVNLGADPTWIDDTAGGTKLRGNNAHAYADVNDNDAPDPAEEVAQVAGDWLFPMTWFTHAECPAFGCTWDSTNNATKVTNQAQATTGLFYLTNRFHDHLLQPPIGFDEASRNFEQVNASGMGLGGDRVRAEANDSFSLNNANFNTPADGSPPRIQMFFWDASWDVSSSDDAEIVYHEYTHGLTNRLVGNGGGGLASFQAQSMGEGWSDWYAMDFLVATAEKIDGPGEDLLFGDYVIDSGTGSGGLRNQRMDCNPDSPATFCPGSGTTGPGGLTFGDLGKFAAFDGAGTHDNGEIWSQTLWDLREELGVHDARAVITGGLRLAPNNPSFVQMRDAILQSALTLGISRTTIWDVFANRGMGFSASTPSSNSTAAVEAFDMPSSLVHVETEVVEGGVLGDGDGYAEPGETLLFTTTLDKQHRARVTDITAELSNSDPGVLLGTKRTSWADMPEGVDGFATNVPPMSATIPENASCGGQLEFSIEVDSSAGPVIVPTQTVPTLGGGCATTAPPLPGALTGGAGPIGATTATVAGEVNPRGTPTSYAFEYGRGHAYDTRTTPQPAGSGSTLAAQSTTITGLRDQTTYQYRILALREGAVVARGERQVLTTAALGCEPAQADLAHAEQRLVEAQQRRSGAQQSAAEAGDELARAERRVSNAKGKLARAKKKLKRARVSGERSDVKGAKMRVRRAKDALTRAEAASREARGPAETAAAALANAEADQAKAQGEVAAARAAVSAHCP